MQKKFMIFLVAGCLSTVAAFSQGLQVGAKAGVNITKVDGESFKDEFKYGYHVGGFAIVKLGNTWGIQPEVLFNQLKTKSGEDFEAVYPNGNNLKNVTLNYLSIPILLNFSPQKFITLQAGPQFGILLDNNTTLLNNGKNAFKSGDFSLLGGAQLNLGAFKVSGRYFVGLNDINDIDNKETWKNQGFQLSLGLRII